MRGCLLWFLVSYSLFSRGQENLVINGGFEEVSTCNFGMASIEVAYNWTNLYHAGSSVDIYNSCCTDEDYSVPSNSVGFQIPIEGNGYAGFIPFGIEEAPLGQLSESLIQDSIYYVSFSVSLCDSCFVGFRKLGAAFFKSAVSIHPWLGDPVESHFEDSTTFYVSKEEWMTLEFLYTAEGYESHVAIGYFHNSPEIDSVDSLSAQVTVGYYYLDNVIVRKATQTDIRNLRYDVLDFGIYPNPASEVLRLSSKARLSRVLIRDVHGTLVQEAKLYGTDNELLVSGLQAGVYLIEAYAENGKRGTQRFVKLSDR